MTVSSTTNKQSYNGNGSQSVFAYGFKIFADTDIQVYVGTTLKTLSTHYTLSGVGAAGGGNVTFTTGNIPASGTGNVTILRSLALTQGVDLVNYGRFDAEVIESQYDKLVMMVQQLQEQADRTIRFNTTVSDAGGVEITDTVAQRSNKVLAYDNAGDLSVANELGEWKGNWATNTAFSTRDLVLDAATNNVYICLVTHTSGTLSNDVSANKWALVINAAAVAASATTATTKASEAAASATTASNQASTSTTKANEAAASAATANTKASLATTKASEAVSSASAAASSASAASSSASAGATSATNSGNSATAAASSASTANTKASEASTSASTATTKANQASTSASAAATSNTNSGNSATASANSATASANSATASGNSATAAASSASTATTKRNESSASATAAANSAAAAATALDSFDDRYLGAKSSAPGQDNDGNALVQGALYFDTSANGMKVYDGSAWIAASSSGTASLLTYKYIATNNQTTFTGSDANSVTLTYTATNILVLLNGITLDASDYTATNGSSIVLGAGATTGSELVVVAFKSFTVADHYTKSQANALLAAKAPLDSPSFTGTVNAPDVTTSAKLTANSSSSGDYVRMYGSSGTGKWDIYGNGANLRFSDNESAGSVVFDQQVNASSGIAIGGTGSANLLSDYETGTWNPLVESANGTDPTVGESNSGYYTKIGRVVHLSGEINITALSGTTTGILGIRGLPFTILAVGGSNTVGSIAPNGLNFSRSSNKGFNVYNGNTLAFLSSNNNAGWGWELVNILSVGDSLRFSITFHTT